MKGDDICPSCGTNWSLVESCGCNDIHARYQSKIDTLKAEVDISKKLIEEFRRREKGELNYSDDISTLTLVDKDRDLWKSIAGELAKALSVLTKDFIHDEVEDDYAGAKKALAAYDSATKEAR